MGAPEDVIDLGGLSCRSLHGPLEAALLFAAGKVQAARACLEEVLERGISDPRAWTMLFDLHRVLGERAQFDVLLDSYRQLFPGAPVPSWSNAGMPAGTGVIPLCGVLARSSDLEPLRAAHRARIVAIDLGCLERLDFTLAPVFCALVRMLVSRGKRIILANVCELHVALLREMGLPESITVLPRRALAAPGPGLALAA